MGNVGGQPQAFIPFGRAAAPAVVPVVDAPADAVARRPRPPDNDEVGYSNFLRERSCVHYWIVEFLISSRAKLKSNESQRIQAKFRSNESQRIQAKFKSNESQRIQAKFTSNESQRIQAKFT